MSKRIPHFLLVEDDPNDQFFLRKGLERARQRCPFTYNMVEDGCVAQSYLNGVGLYDDRAHFPMPVVIVSDIKMPVCGGLELLNWVRHHAATAHLPVVMLTSSDLPADVARAYSLGVNTYFLKPNSFHHLVEWAENFSHYWCDFALVPEIVTPVES